MSEKGKVFLVGAGPGEPKLSTLRAKELIEQCDVLVYDNLANPELRKWRKSECLEVDVGKSPGRHTVEQREIEKTLIQHASTGKMVVRLKGEILSCLEDVRRKCSLWTMRELLMKWYPELQPLWLVLVMQGYHCPPRMWVHHFISYRT